MGQIKTPNVTFLFDIVEACVGTYQKKDEQGKVLHELVQWQASLLAVAAYDEETEQWVDYSSYEDREIKAYLYLFGKDKQPLLNAKQLCKATGWDGLDFSVLDQLDYSKIQIQGRTEEHEYNNKTSIRIAWIDHKDANPTRNLTHLDSDALKKLNAKFASGMRELSGGGKPKSVPAAPIALPVAPPPAPAPVIPAPANPVTQVDPKEALKAKFEAKKERSKKAEAKAAAVEAKLPPKLPVIPPTAPTIPPKADLQQKYSLPAVCTQEQAWESCCQNRKADVSDDDLANVWVQIIGDIGGEEAVGDDWYKVRDGVLEIVGKNQ